MLTNHNKKYEITIFRGDYHSRVRFEVTGMNYDMIYSKYIKEAPPGHIVSAKLIKG